METKTRFEEMKTELKSWGENTRQAKVLELEAGMRFILRNQKFDAFFDAEAEENKGRGTQGSMCIHDDFEERPALFVDWDEVNAFDDQTELFKEIFEGDFSSDKLIRITGVRL